MKSITQPNPHINLTIGVLVLSVTQLYSQLNKELNEDFGLGLYDYGARWYDASLGRFFKIDRFVDSFPDFSGYNYAQLNPLKFIEMNGDSVSVIFSGPTLSQGGSGSSDKYTNGVARHVAINVDGKVYSFEGSGEWKKYDYYEYIKNENAVRHTGELTLNVDQSKIQSALDGRTNGVYDVTTNSCVSNTMEVLRSGGVEIGVPDGAVSPDQLGGELDNSNYVTNKQMHQPNFDKSFSGRLLYSIVATLGLQDAISGTKTNTKDLISNKNE